MADPRMFDTPVEVERTEALRTLQALLEEVPDAATTYAERYSNPHLPSSPADLLLAASLDPAVRGEHGTAILAGTLARIVAHQRQEIAELRERVEELEAAQPQSKSKAKG